MDSSDDIHALLLDFCKSSEQLVPAGEQLVLLHLRQLQGLLEANLCGPQHCYAKGFCYNNDLGTLSM